MKLPFKVGISPELNIRGLIASEFIKKNQVIEKCPVILVPIKEEKLLKETIIWKYYYEWTSKYHAICLGYGSLINHSYKPNTRYYFDYHNKRLVFQAVTGINTGEEITVNYNFDKDNIDKVADELVDFNIHYPFEK